MLKPLARIARSSQRVVADVFRNAQAGADYLLTMFGPIGVASLAAFGVILIRQ